MNEEWYTVEEAAQRLNMTKQGVYYHVFKGHIRKSNSSTKHVRYNKEDVDNLVIQKAREAADYRDRMQLKALFEIFRILRESNERN